MFLFAVGYAVGPQFIRGVAKDGLPQAFFAAVQCVFSLLGVYLFCKMAGYDLGYSAGFYAGSQTISASMGLATALRPLVGYERAADIATRAFREGRTVRQVAEDDGVASPGELDEALDPARYA